MDEIKDLPISIDFQIQKHGVVTPVQYYNSMIGSSFFHFLKINLKRILYYSQSQRTSCLVETIFFHSDFFGSHYCNQREVNIFKKKSYFCQRKPFWKQLFGPAKSHYSRNPSFWLVETDFRLITNIALLFGTFFCWWIQCLKLSENQFSLIFFYSLTAEAVFPASGDGFFYQILHSGEWKWIICLVFFYSEQMLSQWKPLFKLR